MTITYLDLPVVSIVVPVFASQFSVDRTDRIPHIVYDGSTQN